MVKLLPIGLLVTLFLGGLIYVRFFYTPKSSELVESTLISEEEIPDSNQSLLEGKIKLLEDAVVAINKKLTAPVGPTGTPGSLEARVKVLEDQVALLKKQPTQTSTTVVPTTAKKSPLYIPLGSGGTYGDRNFIKVVPYQVNVNPDDYPGYTSMQLEVNFWIEEALGQANVRLYNSTGNSSVTSSQISTTSTSPTLITSTGFTLSSGSKTYDLQVQSTQGVTAHLESARIKVNF